MKSIVLRIRAVCRRLLGDARGQALAFAAFALPVIIGGGAIAVDVGYMYVAKGVLQNAVDAGARAGGAILAAGGTQAEARAEAENFANQNTAPVSYLAGSIPVVSFPAANSVQVNISHPIPLFFAPILGIDTATVATAATAELAPVRTVAPGNLVPLGIYCNEGAGCGGRLAVDQIISNMLRHCGNLFGNSSAACNYSPDVPAENEIFLSGLSFNDNNSTGELKDDVENGYSGEVTLGQSVGALPGTRQGWQQSMRNRLNAGDNEMTFPVIAPSGANDGSVVIVDFVQVRINNFRAGSASRQDEFDFQIIPSAVSSSDFASAEEGLGINSVQGVRLTE